MTRAQGSNMHKLFGWETSYGVPDTSVSYKIPFTPGNTLDDEQNLIDNPVLGFGNDPADAILDVADLGGDVPVPLDMRFFGMWLTAMTGEPTTAPIAATGSITFAANPSAGQTIAINGTVFTFHESPSDGTDIEIKGSAALTVTEIVSVLNGSADTDVDDATYSQNDADPVLTITHDTAGPDGNAFTLAASHAAVSGQTLSGGCYEHIFSSGAADVPSFWVERGFNDVGKFRLYKGLKLNSIALTFARRGVATGTMNVIGQGAENFTETSVDADPINLSLDMVSHFKGKVLSNGVIIGNLMSATLNIGNNLDPIETVGTGGQLSGADKGIASLGGNLGIRFTNTDYIDLARSGGTLPLEFRWDVAPGFSLSIDAPRVKLPKPKLPVEGPGGIEGNYAFVASRDADSGKMYTATLRNDMDGSDYELPEA